MKQEMLPTFEFVPLSIKDEPDFRWYYITRNRDSEMLMTFDRDGKPVWSEHDLQYKIPHVYNTAQQAHKDLKRVGGSNVLMSRYKMIAGNRVVR